MNILFLTSAAPRKAGFSTNEKRPPLGLGTLMAVLKSQGHKVFFSDEYLQRTNILDTDFLKKQIPVVLGKPSSSAIQRFYFRLLTINMKRIRA